MLQLSTKNQKIFLVFTFLFSALILLESCCCVSLPEDPTMTLIKQHDDLTIFGHKNPDLDSYASAFAYAELLKQKGVKKVKAYALGAPNLETQFVLDFLKMKPLPILEKLPEGSKAILVDHNEKAQSLEGLDESRIAQIVDHHRFTLKTPHAVSLEVEPIGSTATLVFKKFEKEQITPSREASTLLLSAILSDTRLLNSPTTTIVDERACRVLSSLVSKHFKNFDSKKFGKEILKAGTRTDHLSVKELYHTDRKTYHFGSQKASIGVLPTLDIPDALKRRDEFVKYMKSFCKEGSFDFCVLMITNSLEKNCHVLVTGDKTLFDKAFANKKSGEDYFLDSVVSRKKQVVPELEKSL